jgi:hypothetical protein
MTQCPYPYNISNPKPAHCLNDHRRLGLARSWLMRTGNCHLSIAVWTDGLSLCKVYLEEFGDFLETFSQRITELEASGRRFSSFTPCLPNLTSLAFSFPNTWIECIKTKFPLLRSLNYGLPRSDCDTMQLIIVFYFLGLARWTPLESIDHSRHRTDHVCFLGSDIDKLSELGIARLSFFQRPEFRSTTPSTFIWPTLSI